MSNPILKAEIIETGKIIEVYKLRNRSGYVDYSDCKTEYKKKEVKIISEIKLK